jgi:hypothetical protein
MGEPSAPGRPNVPGALLPSGTGESTTGMTEPRPITPDLLASLTKQAEVEMAPALLPPTADPRLADEALQAVTGGVTTATWRQNVAVTALWSISETRNAWINLQGVGWKKIINGRDGSFTSLVTLASQAKQTGKPITVREESDGMIYEIYLW